jgi:reversibly glycosylated polypeptide/UDP-arabinopyranose mutase
MNKPAVCIATIRPDHLHQWAEAWADEFNREKVSVFVMHDDDTKDEDKRKRIWSICIDAGLTDLNVYNHHDVALELKDKRWIIPSKTSACKSFAIYKAWKHDRDPIMVLDDDCLPIESPGEDRPYEWMQGHKANLRKTLYNHVMDTLYAPRPRGMPYLPGNPVAISHGLWFKNPDTDAITDLTSLGLRIGNYMTPYQTIPIGALFPMSGMNIAFRREIAPLMYFGLQGPAWGVDRFDDIWCGFLAKKVLDHCGYAVWSGSPYVRHVRASDPFVNIVKEAPGYKMNVELYEWIMNLTGLKPTSMTPTELLKELAMNMIDDWGQNGGREYWGQYGKAILEWLTLFEE